MRKRVGADRCSTSLSFSNAVIWVFSFTSWVYSSTYTLFLNPDLGGLGRIFGRDPHITCGLLMQPEVSFTDLLRCARDYVWLCGAHPLRSSPIQVGALASLTPDVQNLLTVHGKLQGSFKTTTTASRALVCYRMKITVEEMNGSIIKLTSDRKVQNCLLKHTLTDKAKQNMGC